MRRALAPVALLLTLVTPALARGEEQPAKPMSTGTAGLVLFGTSYGLSVGVGSGAYRNEDGTVATKMLVPIVGSWLLLASDAFDHETTLTARLVDATDANDCRTICPGALFFVPVAIMEFTLLVMDPVAQATGLVMAMVGAGRNEPSLAPKKQPDEERASRPKVDVKPTFVGTGPGVALSVTEW